MRSGVEQLHVIQPKQINLLPLAIDDSLPDLVDGHTFPALPQCIYQFLLTQVAFRTVPGRETCKQAAVMSISVTLAIAR
jgi:hypothetical protein